MMFQSFALFPHRTVFQNVEFSLKMKGMEKSARDRRVWEMLEMVGLASFAERRPRDLSGGQQQRVALRARPDQPADRAPARRAARLARFQPAPGDDDRAEKGAAGAEHHLHHGHAFAAGSDVARRQSHRHERRRHPADRHLARGAREPAHQVRGGVHRQQQSVPGPHPLAQRLDRVRRIARPAALHQGSARRANTCRSARKCGFRSAPT